MTDLHAWCPPQFTVNDHNPLDMGNDRTSPIMENEWRCRPGTFSCHAHAMHSNRRS